jgi:hypothetical protein
MAHLGKYLTHQTSTYVLIFLYHEQLHNFSQVTIQFQPDLDFFYRITEFSSRLNISGEPLFKANPALSTIKILTLDAFHNAKVEDIQEIFRKQHIIVTEASMKPKCNFDQAGLLRLARIDQQISINGMFFFLLL